MTRLLKVGLAVSACAAVAAPIGSRTATAAATAAEQNRAVLVVETGEQVKKVCVRFWEESISGAELLRRAEVDAAVRPYAGKGVAVCSLCGVGCRTDDSCLTCDPDGRYWTYSRAPAGTSGFRLSPAGASNTEVGNGDVEGWRWSRGSSPGYVSVEEVCDGAAPAAAPTTTTAPATTSTIVAQPPGATVQPPASTGSPVTTAPPSGSRAGGPTPAVTIPRSPSSAAGAGASRPDLPQPDAMPSAPASSPDAGNEQVSSASDVATAASHRSANNDGGGSPAGLVIFAGVLAGLLCWAAWARRRRRPHPLT
ncbi:MAG TPA: hypothetical protein VNA57_14440 [Acidimicrobiales bacterium]|nr:hypothetical protein [Acidimicrobiales bacterium]